MQLTSSSLRLIEMFLVSVFAGLMGAGIGNPQAGFRCTVLAVQYLIPVVGATDRASGTVLGSRYGALCISATVFDILRALVASWCMEDRTVDVLTGGGASLVLPWHSRIEEGALIGWVPQ